MAKTSLKEIEVKIRQEYLGFPEEWIKRKFLWESLRQKNYEVWYQILPGTSTEDLEIISNKLYFPDKLEEIINK